MDADVLVVGAGPAGLAVAACLRRRGVDVLVVDRGAAVGDSWRKRYDRLHLHTPRVQSALPGLRMPRRFGRWVAKDDVARYLQDYAEHSGVSPRFGTEVRRLEQDGDSWKAQTDGPPLQARQVVIATGYNREPVRPDWPGQASFAGPVLHASGVREPGAVPGQGRPRRRRGQHRRRDRRRPRPGRGRPRVAGGAHAAERRDATARPDPDDPARDLDGLLPRLAGRPDQPVPAAAVRRRPDPVRAAGPAHGRRHADAHHRGHPDDRRGPDPGTEGRADHARGRAGAVRRRRGGAGRRHPARAGCGDRRDRLHDRAPADGRPPRCARRARPPAAQRRPRRRSRGCASSA